MNRIKLAGLATVGALGLSVSGLVGGGVAQADTADDLQTMLANLPDAVDALAAGVQSAVDAFTANQSLDQLSFNLVIAVADGGNALGAGTEQFGLLGLGLALGIGGPVSILQPYLVAIDDDPASVVDLIHPEDLATLAGNLPGALQAAQPDLIEAIVELLDGNLIAGTELFTATGQPAFVGDAYGAVGEFLTALVAGTSFESTVPLGIGVPLLVAVVVAAPYVQQAEDRLAPLFDALAPVTAPIIEALEG
jgi:hypothetical protein